MDCTLSSYRSDSDIYDTARQLLQQHGEKAVIYAVDQALARYHSDDEREAAVWVRILRALDDLTRAEPAGKDTVH